MAQILVIDDEGNIRQLLKNTLSKAGHEVVLAENGIEGLECLKQRRPDLILLDLMMPVLDGYAFLNHIQDLNFTPSIPVIILSALNQGTQVAEGLRGGANDYVTKPFNIDELIARVTIQLQVKELERGIRESETYHRAIFETTSDPDILLDESGNVVQANNAANDLFGNGKALGSIPFQDLVTDDERPKFSVAYRGAIEGSEIPIFESHLQTPDGLVHPFDVDIGPVDINGVRHLMIRLRDIRRRMAAEARSAMIFQHIGDSIFITDSKGTIMLASHSAAKLVNVPDEAIVGQDLTTYLDPEHHKHWEAVTSEQGRQDTDTPSAVFESSLSRGDGTPIPLEWTLARFRVGSEPFFIGVARNLSDRIAAERQRYEAEQMQTLLEIAGGAAHEINQPLTAILGYAEMSLAQLKEGEPLHAHQKHIAEAALRITEIVKRMQALREYRTRPYANGQRIVDFRSDDERRKEE